MAVLLCVCVCLCGRGKLNEHLLCCCIISIAAWVADMRKLQRRTILISTCSITSTGPSLSFMTVMTQMGIRKEVELTL